MVWIFVDQTSNDMDVLDDVYSEYIHDARAVPVAMHVMTRRRCKKTKELSNSPSCILTQI